MTTFREYRDRVSILQLAESLGYKPVKGKFTQARPVLKDAAGDTILIKNPTNPSTQLYWNLGNNLEYGSVIDFVRNNLSRFPEQGRNEIDRINKILSSFAGVAYDNSTYLNQPISEQKIFNENDYTVISPTVNELHYLSSERKISPETIETFLPFIRLVESNGFKNVAFPYTVPDQDTFTKGYEFRNYGGFKSFAAGGDKMNATWVADFSAIRSEVSNLFFFESAIDALSFYEIKPVPFQLDKSVFVSSGGYPCNNQFLHVLNAFPNAERVYGCHDNDLSGHLFDIQLACIFGGHTLLKRKNADTIRFTVNNRTFDLNSEKVTLENFAKQSGLKIRTNALKPNLYKDWNEALKEKNIKSKVKKPVFGIK
jgi:hypothetical protein